MFDAEDPNSQLFLTRVFQTLANINTRKIMEVLAQGPRSLTELLLVIDSTPARLQAAMQVLLTVGLVSEGKSREGTVYLFNSAGLRLARSWLNRVESVVDGRGQL